MDSTSLIRIFTWLPNKESRKIIKMRYEGTPIAWLKIIPVAIKYGSIKVDRKKRKTR